MDIDISTPRTLQIFLAITKGYDVSPEVIFASGFVKKDSTLEQIRYLLGRLVKEGFLTKDSNSYHITKYGLALFKSIKENKDLLRCGHEISKRNTSIKDNYIMVQYICAEGHVTEWKKIAFLPKGMDFRVMP